MPIFPLSLFVLVLALALYDLRARRLPNAVTLPLLITGLALGFPGSPALWLGTILLFAAWHTGGLGGGDAKLWMALLWLAPKEQAGAALAVMALAFTGTAALQLAWRVFRKRRILGVRSPGAWRALPFALWLLFLK